MESRKNIIGQDLFFSLLGQRIKERRIALGWSNADIAYRLGITKKTEAAWESGTNKIPLLRFLEICECFQVSPSSLLGFDSGAAFTEPEYKTVGGRIGAARELAGISAKDLSERIGKPVHAINLWERELSIPKVYDIYLIAMELDVSPDYLLQNATVVQGV